MRKKIFKKISEAKSRSSQKKPQVHCCSFCGKPKHIASRCPAKRQAVLRQLRQSPKRTSKDFDIFTL